MSGEIMHVTVQIRFVLTKCLNVGKRQLDSTFDSNSSCSESSKRKVVQKKTSEMPIQGGSCPYHACGTRFLAHKVAALERIVNRFGAYLSHITAMTEDTNKCETCR